MPFKKDKLRKMKKRKKGALEMAVAA